MFKNVKLLSSIALVILCGCSSNTEKFDSAKWMPVETGLYGENHRKKMLDDLVHQVLKFPQTRNDKGTKKSEVIRLIGKPYQKDCNGYEVYEIEEKTGQIDPNGFLNLKLMYDADSTLHGYIIEEASYRE